MNLNPRFELAEFLRRGPYAVQPLRVYLVRGVLWLGFIVAIAVARNCAHYVLTGGAR